MFRTRNHFHLTWLQLHPIAIFHLSPLSFFAKKDSHVTDRTANWGGFCFGCKNVLWWKHKNNRLKGRRKVCGYAVCLPNQEASVLALRHSKLSSANVLELLHHSTLGETQVFPECNKVEWLQEVPFQSCKPLWCGAGHFWAYHTKGKYKQPLLWQQDFFCLRRRQHIKTPQEFQVSL